MITDQLAYAPGALAEAYFTLPAGYATAASIPVGRYQPRAVERSRAPLFVLCGERLMKYRIYI